MKKSLILATLSLSAAFTFAQTPVKKVLLEEFTGAWCGYCPDGALIVNSILDNNPEAIAIAIHNSDGMVTSEGNIVDNFYNSLGYPGGIVDRTGAAMSRTDWSNAVSTRLNTSAGVAVSLSGMSWDPNTRTITATVNADFTQAMTGNFRFNLYVVEDSVSGTGANFDQVNYYNTNASSPLYGLGNPIVGYKHRHVLRASKGGAWGTSTIIPSTVNAGDHFERTYTHVLNVNHNVDRIHLVGVVTRFDGTTVSMREVLNAEEVKFLGPLTTLDAPVAGENTLMPAPNPFADKTTLNFNLANGGTVRMEATDAMGRNLGVLTEGYMNAGAHSLFWDGADAAGNALANGVYFLRLTVDNGPATVTRVVIAR